MIIFTNLTVDKNANLETVLVVENFSFQIEGTSYIVNDQLSVLLNLIGPRGLTIWSPLTSPQHIR